MYSFSFNEKQHSQKLQQRKTSRRWATSNVHFRAAFHRVGILTVFSSEDTLQQTALLPAQERLLAGDAQQFRLNPRPAIRENAKLRFHAFQVSFENRGRDATDSVSDWELAGRESPQKDAEALATEGCQQLCRE